MMMVDRNLNEYILERAIFGLMIWREAAGESVEGQRAVAMSVMNRIAKEAKQSWWGRSPWEAIVKPKQYTSMTFLGDPMTIRFPPTPDDPVALQCVQIAADALDGRLTHPAPGADSYYSITMKKPPFWADDKKFVKQIGNHRFYNLDGDQIVDDKEDAA